MAFTTASFSLTFQFPVIDLRPLLYVETGRMQFPTPSPLPKKDLEFIRNFGQVQYRNHRDNLAYIDEELFCSCSNLIKFPVLVGKRPWFDGAAFEVLRLVTYRRFFSDGGLIAKFQVQFNCEVQFDETADKKAISTALLDKLMEMPVQIRGKETSSTKLIDAGKKLSEVFRFSSTKVKTASLAQPWWVESGEPAIFYFTPPAGIPEGFQGLALEKSGYVTGAGLELAMYEHITKSQKRIKTWCCASSNGEQPEHLKEIGQLKSYLLRCHSQLQFLKHFFAKVAVGTVGGFQRGTRQSDLIQQFLVDIHLLLTQQSASGMDRSKLVLGMFRMDSFIADQEKTVLLQRLEAFDFRRNTFQKTVGLIEGQDLATRRNEIMLPLKEKIALGQIESTLDALMGSIDRQVHIEYLNQLLLFKGQWTGLADSTALDDSERRMQSNQVKLNLMLFLDTLELGESELSALA